MRIISANADICLFFIILRGKKVLVLESLLIFKRDCHYNALTASQKCALIFHVCVLERIMFYLDSLPLSVSSEWQQARHNTLSHRSLTRVALLYSSPE